MTQMSNQSCCTDLGALLRADLFRALGDPNRLSILSWLATGGEATVSEIATGGCCSISMSVVSRHLKALREAGILKARKRGKEVLYTVQIQPLVDRLRAIADALETCCPDGVCGPLTLTGEIER
jgi:DNA-binding transcriptional ArsR family regulator